MANLEETLSDSEIHPSTYNAYAYIIEHLKVHPEFRLNLKTGYANGDRDAGIYLSTVNRILNKEPVSDRYILGLAWHIMFAH